MKARGMECAVSDMRETDKTGSLKRWQRTVRCAARH
jgi:hypothetical protein